MTPEPVDAQRMRLRLPATSANLGPGFDAVALALDLLLEIEAVPAPAFCIEATGRNADVCARLERNLLLETYRQVLIAAGRPLVPLALTMRNQIPIGMGCGSSAAVRLAGVALADRFGCLGLNREQILKRAASLEGHPDNVAACWLGGLAVAAAAPALGPESGMRARDEIRLQSASFAPPAEWRALLVVPERPLATTRARAVLPESYSRADTVSNVQSVALLVAAFAHGRGELLRLATRDRIHQPYRAEICPLLPALLPLAGKDGVLSVTLSGAGPSVLLLLAGDSAIDPAKAAAAECLGRAGARSPAEMLVCHLRQGGAEIE